jgi:multiple sugar transport system ATP-binding protein
MRGGELQQLGTPAEVYGRPANLFVAGFMGSPRMNLLRATLVQSDRGLDLDLGNGVRLALQSQPEAVRAFAGKEVIAGVRAEAISHGAGNSQRQSVRAKVEITEPTGADTLVVLDLAGHEVTARLEPDFPLQPGDEGEFGIDLGRMVFFDPASEKRIG